MGDLEGHEGAAAEPSLSGAQRRALEKPAGALVPRDKRAGQVRKALRSSQRRRVCLVEQEGQVPAPEQLHWGTQPRSAWLGRAVTHHHRTCLGAEAPWGTERHLPYLTLYSYPRWLVSRSLQLTGTSMPSRILTAVGIRGQGPLSPSQWLPSGWTAFLTLWVSGRLLLVPQKGVVGTKLPYHRLHDFPIL